MSALCQFLLLSLTPSVALLVCIGILMVPSATWLFSVRSSSKPSSPDSPS